MVRSRLTMATLACDLGAEARASNPLPSAIEPLSLKSIFKFAFKFHSLTYISLTQKCPIRCRHCFVDSGPDRTESVDETDFDAFLVRLCASRKTELVLFSGGEPFSHPNALRNGLRRCQEAGVLTIVGTSGYWGRNPAHAKRFLERFPGIDFLWFSTDIFHEEFVSLDILRNAILTSQSLGIPCGLQIAENTPDNSDFIRRLQASIGDDLPGEHWYVTPLSALGRANEEATEELAQRPDSGPGRVDKFCPWLSSPWVHEDGRIVACPNTEAHESGAAGLLLGRIGDTDWSEISSKAERDGFLHLMRTLGPAAIFDLFPDMKPDQSPKTICDDCLHVARNSGFVARVRAAAQDAELGARIGLMRAAYYGEPFFVGAEPCSST